MAEENAKRVDARDLNKVAEFVMDERARRRDDTKRVHLEKLWKEVDRQVAMEPKKAIDTQTRAAPGSEWMPETELPLQAQALEVLTADARRLMFPADRDWFQAEAVVTDEYLERAEAVSAVYGDRAEIPNRITQDDANALAEAAIMHFEGQYDFRTQVDRMNAEAFKYGTFVGRVGMVRRDVISTVPGGVRKDSDFIPALVPQSIRDVLLDTTWQASMHEGLYVQPSYIRCYSQRYDDLKLAAEKGDKDPEKPNGGWMPKALASMETAKGKMVDLVEFEGDIVIPRSTTDSLFVANVIVTVLDGKSGGVAGNKVIRLRMRNRPWRSYVVGPYHLEDTRTPYGVGPLMKGYPIQMAATEALCRLIQAGALNVLPPVWMDPSDYRYDVEQPQIAPGQIWRTYTEPKAIEIGDPAGLLNVYVGFLRQYEDLTGVSAPRLGAQTKSHTTAYANQQELLRGQSRTTDYVTSSLEGPWSDMLMRMYDLARDAFDNRTTPVWVERVNGFVGMTRALLPPAARFWAQGGNATAEEAEKQAKRVQALTTVLQIEPLVMQAGGTPMNLDRLRADLLKEGGIVDVERYIPPRPATGAVPGMQGSAAPAPVGPGMAGPGAMAAE